MTGTLQRGEKRGMNLQHAQHDAHFGLHSSNGRISQALTHVFDLQNVCLLGLLVPNCSILVN